MNIKRFFANSSREALRQVKRELGADSVILSNRRVEGGVEIMAIAHAEAQAIDAAAREPAVNTSGVRTALNNQPVRPSRPVHHNALQSDPAKSSPVPNNPPQFNMAATKTRPEEHATPAAIAQNAAEPAGSNPAVSTPGAEHMVRTVIREIQSMRGLLHEQLSGLVFGEMQRRDPDKLRMLSALIAGGFSPALSRRLIEKAPAGIEMTELRAWIKRAIDKNMISAGADEIVARGGVYALLGPTGVGKTTTTAKLAARCVVRYGAEKLALITTDNYRVGAHEHLRIYGRILGVAVHAVRDGTDLESVLTELRDKHMVLVDTVGMSQKDQHVAEQIAMLTGAGEGIKRLLLLNATCQGDTLEDVVRAYRGKGLSGCVITKADEAASLGAVLDTVIRHKLPIQYVANGQRVPEDLHPVNREYLLHRALGVSSDNPARTLAEQDIAAALASAELAF